MNINSALPAGEPSYDIHFDDAPTFYVNGQPERTNPALRKLEQDAGAATLPDPVQGRRADADRIPARRHRRGERAAHGQLRSEADAVVHDVRRRRLLLPDRKRLQGTVAGSGRAGVRQPGLRVEPRRLQDEIGNTWFGMVGPGVDKHGVDNTTWTRPRRPASDDQRPARSAGQLPDDGRVVTQVLDNQAIPKGLDTGHITRGSRQRPTSRSTRRSGSSRTTRSLRRPRRSRRADRAEVRLDRGVDREPDVTAERARRRDPASAERRRVREREARPDQAKDWIKQAQSLLDQAHALAVANPAS